ncbi:conserved hypothetical protein [Altererythrobacter sp. B11]|uniref:hypothetical protein n=1 Tax=Altererythrobacter sp. B11 TaxID=2060312 RepID=UPI000DC70D15|nr:hypothetical protein [Altererythrobacter sp. B11]BBC71514.1 conserved hypothetical protein [Altererythrobacter sp. B11]
MRPQSILMFERLFLLSLAISAASFLIGYGDTVDLLARQPGMEELGLGSGFVIATFAFGFAIYLLLWFFIARRASNIAKWVLTFFVAIGLFSLPGIFAADFTVTRALGLLTYLLEVAALVFLFRADAILWLKGEAQDPEVFD